MDANHTASSNNASDSKDDNDDHNEEEEEEEEEEWDVIIVGAGQAGMAAAHRLIFEQEREHEQEEENKPIRLLVIEASDHIGGRTRNYDCVRKEYDVISDHVVELGGTWISPSHTSTLNLLKHLHLDVYNASFLLDEKNDAIDQAIPGEECDDGDEKKRSPPPVQEPSPKEEEDDKE